MKTLLLCCLLVLFCSVKSNLTNYCLPIHPIAQEFQGQPIPEPIQGRPGKIGPVGPPGPGGLTGSPGTPGGCACNRSEIEELRTEMQIMRETLNSVSRFATREEGYYSWCGAGIKDGRISNSAMTSSSNFSNGYLAYHGRLDNTGEPRGFWYPQDSNRNGAWLQVDLGSSTRVIGVVTHGRPVNNDHWITSYKILYGNTTSSLISIQSQDSGSDMIFEGNRNMNSKVTNYFPQPITARYFRLVTVTYHGHPALRIEYLTC